MHRKNPHALPCASGRRTDARLLALFKGGDGLGMILYFWALMGSLIGGVTLVAGGVVFWIWWALLAGLIALRIYAYLGHIGHELLDRITPHDG